MAFNGKFVLSLSQFAGRQEADIKPMIEISNVSENDLSPDYCRLDNEIYNTIIGKAVEMTNYHYFGMHAGEHLNLLAARLNRQIAQTSETVKLALDFCCEFVNSTCCKFNPDLAI